MSNPNLTGVEFHQALKRIGYEPALNDAFAAHADWIVLSLPVQLVRLICSLGKENALSPQELAKFKELEKSGRLKPDAEAIRLARLSLLQREGASTLSQSSAASGGLEALRQKVEALRAQKQQLQIQKDAVNRKYQLLSEKTKQSVSHNRCRVVEEERLRQATQTVQQQVVQPREAEIQAAHKRLSERVDDASSIHKNSSSQSSSSSAPVSSSSPPPPPSFLAHTSLTKYMDADEEFARGLKPLLTKVRVYSGGGSSSKEDDLRAFRLEFDRLEDNISYMQSQSSAGGESKAEVDEDVMKQRYRTDYVDQFLGERGYMTQLQLEMQERVSNAMMQSRVSSLRRRMQSELLSSLLGMDQGALQLKLNKNLKEISSLRLELKQKMEQAVQQLIPSVVEMDSYALLQSDRVLKMARETYKLELQSKIIHKLLEQKARHLLLQSSLDNEKEIFSSTARLLEQSRRFLEAWISSSRSRIHHVAGHATNYQMEKAQREAGIIPASDAIGQALYKLLSHPQYRSSSFASSRMSEAQAIPESTMHAAVQALAEELAGRRTQVDQNRHACIQLYASLMISEARLRASVFGTSSSVPRDASASSLSQPDFSAKLHALESELSQTSKRSADMMSKLPSNMHQARAVTKAFTLYMLDPQRFAKLVSSASSASSSSSYSQ